MRSIITLLLCFVLAFAARISLAQTIDPSLVIPLNPEDITAVAPTCPGKTDGIIYIFDGSRSRFEDEMRQRALALGINVGNPPYYFRLFYEQSQITEGINGGLTPVFTNLAGGPNTPERVEPRRYFVQVISNYGGKDNGRIIGFVAPDLDTPEPADDRRFEESLLNPFPVRNIADPKWVDVSCKNKRNGYINLAPSTVAPSSDARGLYDVYVAWNNGPRDRIYRDVEDAALSGDVIEYRGQDQRGLDIGKYDVTFVEYYPSFRIGDMLEPRAGGSCEYTYEYVIAEPESIRAVVDVTNETCTADNNGAIRMNITGGMAGTYRIVYIYDKNNLVNPPIPRVAFATADPASEGSNPSVVFDLIEGVHPYDINTEMIDFNTVVTNYRLPAGQYYYKVADYGDLDCTTPVNFADPITSFVVLEPPTLSITPVITGVTCFGGNDGSIRVDVVGGVPPYAIDWTDIPDFQRIPYRFGDNDLTDENFNLWRHRGPNKPTQDYAGLASGQYTFTVRDANGCSITRTVTVPTPAEIMIAIQPTDAGCMGFSDGRAVAVVTGGTAPYTYLWTAGQVNNNPPLNQPTDPNVDGLISGIYSVWVTDANGCEAMASVNIDEVQKSQLRFDRPGNIVIRNVSCFAGNDGNITLLPATGSPREYRLSNGAVSTPGTSGEGTFGNLPAGTYKVEVRDVLGCLWDTTLTVTQPARLTVDDIELKHVSCRLLPGSGTSNPREFDGMATVRIVGGTAPYRYEWAKLPNSGTPIFTGDPNRNFIAGLNAGTYAVTTTDANNCFRVDSFTIEEPRSELTAKIRIVENVKCNPDNDGPGGPQGYEAVLEVDTRWHDGTDSGTPPYQFFWTAPSVSWNGDPNDRRSRVFRNIPSDNYTVYVVDANGCETQATISGAQMPVPAPIIVTTNVSKNVNSCDPADFGIVQVTVNGGTRIPGRVPSMAYEFFINDLKNPFKPRLDGMYHNPADPFGALYDPNSTPPQITGLTQGTYILRVMDANGCFRDTEFRVAGNPAGIQGLILDVTDVSCFGGTDGGINIRSTVGGAAPYNYQWINVVTGEVRNTGITSSVSGLPAGRYMIRVTDNIGCTYQEFHTVDQPDRLRASFENTPVVCFNQDNGQIRINVLGGVAPFNITLNENFTEFTLTEVNERTFDVTNISVGTYEVRIVDANGCIFSELTTVEQPDRLETVTFETELQTGDPNVATQRNISCHNANNGWLAAVPMGGNPPYTFVWTNGAGAEIRRISAATTDTLKNLAAGTYRVVVTDTKGCLTEQSGTIINPAAIVYLTNTITPSSECDNPLGQIKVNFDGGTPPFRYTLFNRAFPRNDVRNNPVVAYSSVDSFAFFPNVLAGSYNVTVQDYNGCTFEPTQIFTVTEPAKPVVAAVMVSEQSCRLENRGIARVDQITLNGAAQNFNDYIIYWFLIGQPNNPENAVATGRVVSLPAGRYYAVAVNRNTNCRNKLAEDPTSIVEITAPAPLAIDIVTTEPRCFGDVTGSFRVTINGGTAPFNYSVTLGGGGIVAEGRVAEGAPRDFGVFNRVPGEYFLTVTDANGCVTTQRRVIEQPPAIITNISDVRDAACGGSFRIIVTGGTERYLVEIVSQADGQVKDSYRAGPEGPNSVRGLEAGNYTVRVTDFILDENGRETVGCVYEKEVVNIPNRFRATVTNTFIRCADENANVRVEINGSAAGGEAPYTVRFSNGVVRENVIPAPGNTVAIISQEFGVGVHDVTIIDRGGCSIVQSFEVLNAAFNPVVTVRNNTPCVGNVAGPEQTGGLAIRNTGGVKPYRYTVFNNGELVDQILTNNEEVFFALPAGSYTLSAVDAEGCTVNLSSTFTISNVEPMTTEVVDILGTTCREGSNDGSASLLINGGQSPYEVLWSNNEIGQFATMLPGGEQYVIVSDRNGCVQQIFFDVPRPATQLRATARITNQSSCMEMNGEVDLTVSGGVPPYMFAWSNGATTEDLVRLEAGVYTGTVTDANGCVIVAEVEVEAPAAPVISAAEVTSPSCAEGSADGAINITVTGGRAPYTYMWSNGATTQDLTGLAPGVYSGTITDANGCVVVGEVEIVAPAGILFEAAATPVSECGASDGSIDVTITVREDGSTSTFTYEWSNGSTGRNISGLASGNYMVTITDTQSGCEYMRTVYVGQPSTLGVRTVSSPISCNGETDGSIRLTISGGEAPYTIAWEVNGEAIEGQDGDELTGLGEGVYTALVTDAEGCYIDTVMVNMMEPEVLAATADVRDAACNGAEDGAIMLTVSGGTAPYRYNWSNGARTAGLEGVAGGEYTVTITDFRGCTTSLDVTVGQPEAIELNATVTNAGCTNPTDGSIELEPAGGEAPYTIRWSTGATTATISSLTPGVYMVTVSDAAGCSTMEEFTVETETQNERPRIIVTGELNFCEGGSVLLSLPASVTGTILWSNGEQTQGGAQGLVVETSGTYYATVNLGACGEVQSDTVVVTVSPTPQQPEVVNEADTLLRITTPTAGLTINWYVRTDEGDVLINGATASSFAVTEEGVYFARVRNAGGCTADSDPVTVTTRFGRKNTLPLAVYPNPTNGVLNLRSDAFIGADVTVKVVNMMGQTMMVQSFKATDSLQSISLETLAAGTYSVQVIAKGQSWAGNVTKQ